METIVQRKKTITIGEISPEDSRPAIVLPAHPSMQRESNRGALSIVNFRRSDSIMNQLQIFVL